MTEKEKKALVDAYKKKQEEEYQTLCENREPVSEGEAMDIEVRLVEWSHEEELEVLKNGKYTPEQRNVMKIESEQTTPEQTSKEEEQDEIESQDNPR